MNWDQVKGEWKIMKGKAQERWGELTDDELDQAAGEREQLEGLVQKRYGKTKEAAKEEVDSWLSDVS
ncbi:CsbD family protein [Sedimentitalea todarodis]|uniref:CsbD family protein n=1 Tax=Sedimentitalea todarodis TaxID=1631240 RepID=A0ABU3VHN7_9RHOB|nr:CsbD family protein [Sedimentitalea todarodis]MDU9005189.1 CsbD family protein [Sedimentitalea todarodis]